MINDTKGNYQTKFIELSRQVNALSFGSFTLKSGRISPYFFNAGKFNTGLALWKLADCYADKIIEDKIDFDLLFGPAYKGIPLVSAVAVLLSQKTGKEIPWAFNRKESKDHGEGGIMVGSPIVGKVLVIDDVMTAGTAVKETITLLSGDNAQITDVLVALDRQEVAPNNLDAQMENESNQKLSAMQIIERHYNIRTHAVIKLENLIDYVKTDEQLAKHIAQLESYQATYGI